MRLDWLVHYDGPEGTTTYAIDEPPERESIRDPAEEQRKLAALPLPYADIPQLANRSKELPQQPAAHALLDGVAALTFVERVLPQLEPAGVRVRLEGKVREYRRTSAQPSVQVAAVERADSADWFDLRIKVSIDGEAVPFGELFVALTENQDFLILDTGVYFSLDRPEFVQLRELIEESKASTGSAPPGAEHQSIPSKPVGGSDQPGRGDRSVGSLGANRTRTPGTSPRSMMSRFPRHCRRRCGRISSTDTAGCASCGAINWAASSPTIWALERPSRHSRSSAAPG